MGSKAVKFKDNSGNAVYPCPYYPVGSIYMSVNNINPSEFFGGTWEQIKDRFLLACGSTYKNGTTGGEASHQLTVNEMPSHSHTKNSVGWTGSGGFWVGSGTYTTLDFDKDTGLTGYTGGNQAHNNMPPYLAVYVWKRTA